MLLRNYLQAFSVILFIIIITIDSTSSFILIPILLFLFSVLLYNQDTINKEDECRPHTENNIGGNPLPFEEKKYSSTCQLEDLYPTKNFTEAYNGNIKKIINETYNATSNISKELNIKAEKLLGSLFLLSNNYNDSKNNINNMKNEMTSNPILDTLKYKADINKILLDSKIQDITINNVILPFEQWLYKNTKPSRYFTVPDSNTYQDMKPFLNFVYPSLSSCKDNQSLCTN